MEKKSRRVSASLGRNWVSLIHVLGTPSIKIGLIIKAKIRGYILIQIVFGIQIITNSLWKNTRTNKTRFERRQDWRRKFEDENRVFGDEIVGNLTISAY